MYGYATAGGIYSSRTGSGRYAVIIAIIRCYLPQHAAASRDAASWSLDNDAMSRNTAATSLIQHSCIRRRKVNDCMTSWLVLCHPVYGQLGWFLGWRVFRIVQVDISRNRISADENSR